MTRTLIWDTHSDTWQPITAQDVPSGPVQRAESWLTSGEPPRALAGHMARFGATPPQLWEATLQHLAAMAQQAQGETNLHTTLQPPMFPRLAQIGTRFYLHIRPAPSLRPTTVLTLLTDQSVPDPRTQPQIKGPDLAALASFRARHLCPGTDDVILGNFAETTTGALVGWQDKTLIIPQETHLPSTTQQRVVQHARAQNITIATGDLHTGQALWFLNAVQGISPVTAVVSHGVAPVSIRQHPAAQAWIAWWQRGAHVKHC